MIISTPSDYIPVHSRMRDSSTSPLYRTQQSTPKRMTSDALYYESPMLTPSPLHKRSVVLKAPGTNGSNDIDDIFLRSPFKTPPLFPHMNSSFSYSKPKPISADDDEGAIFLASPPAPSSPFIPPSISQPLRTPVKQAQRPVLSVKHLNGVPHSAASATSPVCLSSTFGAGTKRKSTPLVSTPLRRHNLTPLAIHTPQSQTGAVSFDRLAPLPAPRFAARTPQTNAETDNHLRRQTATLTRLRITDLNDSGDEFGGGGNDSGCDIREEDDDKGNALFLRPHPLPRVSSHLPTKGKPQEETAEAVSPGGHITKRRARSRPVSAELLESVYHSPASAPRTMPRSHVGPIPFPSARLHKRNASTSSSSDTGSPLPRRRANGTVSRPATVTQPQPPRVRPLNRIESATLFFGPAIDQPSPKETSDSIRPRFGTRSTSSSDVPAKLTVNNTMRPKAMNRHSYGDAPRAWTTMQARSASPSPQSSPLASVNGDASMDTDVDDEALFFGSGPQNSSFVFSVTEGTPPPRSRNSIQGKLPKKYKPRDSGVVVSDDDESIKLNQVDYIGCLSSIPRASSSVSSIHSDPEDGLVTPGIGPSLDAGWPDAGIHIDDGSDATERSIHRTWNEGAVDVDAFIMRTLTASSKRPQEQKRVPGTPVKKVRTTYLAGERPWQSAVTSKVADPDYDFGGASKKGKVPRKSLPAALPALALGHKDGPSSFDISDSEGEAEDSPSGRRENKRYHGLGLGRPSIPNFKNGFPAVPRPRWLLRKSSSGVFSNGSDAGTPTSTTSQDWHLPPPRVPVHFSPSNNSLKVSSTRSSSSSSNSSVTTLNSPSLTIRHLPIGSQRRPPSILPDSVSKPRSPSGQEQVGRLERDFVEVDEVGSGEFGKVIKVRRKLCEGGEVYAVKKSKRFEGVRHRLRLREEVDILQHLSKAVAKTKGDKIRHPNVLAYIDSWEEDEYLYIQTELCESGNFARFLWEYGRTFPRLDEARVWKIFADLSNGLRFIHDAGVIHLDIKPANIFVTSDGRFKIGDFGMASLWPRHSRIEHGAVNEESFEREGDKVYLAPEVLQGTYGKAADVFSLGMTMLETASNIVVPDQGEAWHRLRQEDFSLVDLDDSPELLELISDMMRTDPRQRIDIHTAYAHPVVSRARLAMDRMYTIAKRDGLPLFSASPLASVDANFLECILERRPSEGNCQAMDVCS